ncbi:glycosyltransferase family 2 protein [Cuspidothrix issatschenkoi]
MPKVGVCISTYNRVNLLAYAVKSVLSQTYTDFELIICDDGSTWSLD